MGFGWGVDSIELCLASVMKKKIQVISDDDGGLCDRGCRKEKEEESS